MSRTKPREKGMTNPVKMTITYKPNSGEFVGYNREAKEPVTMKKVKMIILDADRFSLTGFSDDHQTGFISNYVLSPKKEDFRVGVFTKGSFREVAKGKYSDIKGDLTGVKFTKPVFALVEHEGEKKLTEILFDSNVARSTFMEWLYNNEDDAMSHVIEMKAGDKVFSADRKTGEHKEVPKSKQGKWLTTWFKLLEITLGKELTTSQEDEADEADKVLQDYLNYLSKSNGDGAPTSSKYDDSDSEDEDFDEEEDDLPF